MSVQRAFSPVRLVEVTADGVCWKLLTFRSLTDTSKRVVANLAHFVRTAVDIFTSVYDYQSKKGERNTISTKVFAVPKPPTLNFIYGTTMSSH